MYKVAMAAVLGAAVLAGCGGGDGSESNPVDVVEAFESTSNAKDIEGVVALFSEDSTITGHPLRPQVVEGLDAIRDLLEWEADSAAESDPYEISNVEASGDTVTWDHIWTNRRGEEWCGTGNIMVIADDSILSWTFAPDPAPCT